jgi:hypothetical protein
MKILIKFPTRGRPGKFFQTLNKYIELSEDISKIGFVISLDEDDLSMNNEEIIRHLEIYKKNIKLNYTFGHSKTKIQAINSDMNRIQGWEIVLLASDDMVPVVKGYDNIIRRDMFNNFPDTDGVLWYSDGGQDNINTLCILGKKYFDRFNYIYNPSYISLWCDNEFTDVSVKLERVYKSQEVIIEHQHYHYQKTNFDELYARNQSYFEIDKQVYLGRAKKNFDL